MYFQCASRWEAWDLSFSPLIKTFFAGQADENMAYHYYLDYLHLVSMSYTHARTAEYRFFCVCLECLIAYWAYGAYFTWKFYLED